MWMNGENHAGNLHTRNQFGAAYPPGYNGPVGNGAGAAGDWDWKDKLMESGQWLGGKVLEYGGRLARGGRDSWTSHDHIPGQMDRNIPHNDGRANWMADIRNSSTSSSSAMGYHGSGGGGYQNDFAVQRPKPYADVGYSQNAPPGAGAKNPFLKDEEKHSHRSKGKSRRVKKKGEKDKKSKSRKHRSKKESSESEASSESSASESEDVSSESEASSESDHKRHKISKKKTKKTKKGKKTKAKDFLSEESSQEEQEPQKKVKPPSDPNYSYSFDPSKLPKASSSHTSNSTSKSSKKKSKKKSRRHSVQASDSDESEEEKPKKRGSNTKTPAPVPDLLDMDFGAPSNPPIQSTITSNPEPSIFDQPTYTPMQELSELSLGPADAAPTTPVATPEPQPQPQPQQTSVQAPKSNVLPENDLVNWTSITGEAKSASDKKAGQGQMTLNDLQKARGGEQPRPVMQVQPSYSMMMPGEQTQSMSSAMVPMQMGMQPMAMNPPQQQFMMPNASYSMQYNPMGDNRNHGAYNPPAM